MATSDAYGEATSICSKTKQLEDTDYSLNKSSSRTERAQSRKRKLKKNIGPYTFYLNDQIGRGFSSVVYRGFSKDNSQKMVAIKMIELGSMSSHRRRMLDNEIRIMRQLNHPHVLELYDVLYTAHNCYLITQLCEGGSLQQLIDNHAEVPHSQVLFQIGSALQYLFHHRIIHRDIKPANILIHEGTYKLADFGFACEVGEEGWLKENYTIGSPLYMAPQALSKNVYSFKGDSFAFGVLCYYLLAGRHPWNGRSKAELIKQHQKRPLSLRHIALLPPRIKDMLCSWLEIEGESRAGVEEWDLTVLLRLPPPRNPSLQLESFKKDYALQVKICQYVSLLLRNMGGRTWVQEETMQFMSKQLTQMVEVFQWRAQPSLIALTKDYLLFRDAFSFSSDHYHFLNNCIKDSIEAALQPASECPPGLLEKLLHYRQLVECILYGTPANLRELVDSLQLHFSFQLLQPDHQLVEQLLSRIDPVRM